MLRKIDLILPVSHFTRDKMMQLHSLPNTKFAVLNNCLDPFMEQPLQQGKAEQLLKRYGLDTQNQVLLTVSRMADSEQYKGYDRVIEALPELIKDYPKLRYLLVGKYDSREKIRLDALIEKLGLHSKVIFTGFIADQELATHFNLADIFIMPSTEEGFGIVFIEAMFYGLPVIAGNNDGSVDALCNGELGLLVDPGSIEEIEIAIRKILKNSGKFLPDEEKLEADFGYKVYKQKLNDILKIVRVS